MKADDLSVHQSVTSDDRCLVEVLRGSLSSSDETRQTLTRVLKSTRTQLSAAERELTSVREQSRQQAEVLSHAAATITGLAAQMNNVVNRPPATDDNDSKVVGRPPTAAGATMEGVEARSEDDNVVNTPAAAKAGDDRKDESSACSE